MASTAQVATPALPKYAQVAIPVHLSKTFTYRLPSSMRRDARVGSRVMVPLATKPVTGYIVALLPALRTGTSLVESEIKEVEQLLDTDPPLTPQVLEITRWVADYYAAPWGEVMRAALPAGINATVEEIISITDKGRAELASLEHLSVPPAVAGGSGKPTLKSRALRLLVDEGKLELKTLCLRMGVTKTPKWLREMEADGLIERVHRARSTFTRAKRRKAVRLIEFAVTVASEETEAQKPRLTQSQQR